jgi:UDP-N-acetylmuramoyl-tripeptide--D-alanyl-D-alanine ligase
MTTLHLLVALVIGMAASVPQALRWLRVLQREHYEPASTIRFAHRWNQRVANKGVRLRLGTLSVVAVAFFLLMHAQYVALVIVAAYGVFAPLGLSLKGRTGGLQWTRRLRRNAIVLGALELVLLLLGFLLGAGVVTAALLVFANPALVALAATITAPIENRDAKQFVEQARARLERLHPTVVAITGSYGKTSTKNHLVDLLRGESGVVASPRSFNNRAGLSRAINENLTDDASVFIAEMGTYGPGEIRDLVSWCRPDISVVTTIGPVHLERMKSLETIEAAKREIVGPATTVVLNIDDERLSSWVEELRANGKRVVTAGSKNSSADVVVSVEGDEWVLSAPGVSAQRITRMSGVQPTNVAVALAVATLVSTRPVSDVLAQVSTITTVANRANVVTAPSGVVVIDDTFNANPASAQASLALLAAQGLPGRNVVVTPGLVELGASQRAENSALAKAIVEHGFELVAVNRTNLAAFRAGAGKGFTHFDTRAEAVAWVREALVPGDGVLYLNDLPDHYP